MADDSRMWRVVTRGRARWVAAATLVTAAVVVAACTSGGSGPKRPTSASGGAPAAQPLRWWSNALAVQGSTVDPADPAAVAAHLSPSTSDYCGMLRQTLDAGHNLFTGAHAGDVALVSTTEAFLAEIARIAPANIAAQWTTLAPTIEAIVAGKPLPSNSSEQARLNQAAALAISTDAKHTCGLTLSS
jgi:hypothetical protein